MRPRRPPPDVGLLLALIEGVGKLCERYPIAASIVVGSVIGTGMGWMLFQFVR